MIDDRTPRQVEADELTNLHFSLVALLAEDRRDEAAELLKTLTPAEESKLWARSLFDTLFLATALSHHLGIAWDDLPAWLRSFGRRNEDDTE